MMTERTPQFDGYEPSSDQASKAMSGNRKEQTKCEVAIQDVLDARGLEYETHADDLPGTPDIVFRGKCIAIFVDGDFWHGRKWKERRNKLREGSNASYWVPKIRANMERDKRYSRELSEQGWLVLRFWETDILENPNRIAAEIENRLEDANGESTH